MALRMVALVRAKDGSWFARKVIPGVRVRGALVRMGKLAVDRARWDWDEVARNPFFSPDAEAGAGADAVAGADVAAGDAGDA